MISCSWSPLLEAAAHGQTDILWDLIHEYGYDANDSFELESHCEEIYGSGKDRQEEHSLCRGTALTLALEFGHWPTAALLISEGADVNAMFYGESAQTYNSFGYELVRPLIEHGADNDYESDDDDYEGVYKSAISHGDAALINSLGLMERVVSELKEAKQIRARQEERRHDLSESHPELVGKPLGYL